MLFCEFFIQIRRTLPASVEAADDYFIAGIVAVSRNRGQMKKGCKGKGFHRGVSIPYRSQPFGISAAVVNGQVEAALRVIIGQKLCRNVFRKFPSVSRVLKSLVKTAKGKIALPGVIMRGGEQIPVLFGKQDPALRGILSQEDRTFYDRVFQKVQPQCGVIFDVYGKMAQAVRRIHMNMTGDMNVPAAQKGIAEGDPVFVLFHEGHGQAGSQYDISGLAFSLQKLRTANAKQRPAGGRGGYIVP